ncbi:MAG: hypothetical protein OCD01_08270 [Fibrobacterales bacterium]
MKMLKKMIVAVVLVGSVFTGNAMAGDIVIPIHKINLVNHFSYENANESYFKGRVVLEMDPFSINGCVSGYVLLPTENNSFMKSMILTSMTMGTELIIAVDPSVGAVKGLCQASYIKMRPSN